MHKHFSTTGILPGIWLMISFCLTGSAKAQDGENQLSAQEAKQGWLLLFDGRTTQGWRTYQNKADDSWEVSNGELHCKMQGPTSRADLVTLDQYSSFELELDWKIAKQANSGVLYHVLESHEASYETGPEVQLIDDFGYADKLADWQKSGADYAMHPPMQLVSKPVGEYNHLRLLVNGAQVTQWLNGVKVVEFIAWTPEWEKLKASGKWKDYPDYGLAKTGLIALQNHGGGIWFKNIKIRKL